MATYRLGEQAIEADVARLIPMLPHPVLFMHPLVADAYNGVAVGGGSYLLSMTQSPWNLPAGVRAIYVRLSARWSSNDNTIYALMRPSGGTGATVVVRPQVAGVTNDIAGLVPCNSSGQVELIVSADASWLKLEIWGYI